MEIALIVCGSIYLATIIYNLIVARAIANEVVRRIRQEHPELTKKKIHYSVSEKIVKFLPIFIPLFHIGMALIFLLNYEYLVEETYDKTVIKLANS